MGISFGAGLQYFQTGETSPRRLIGRRGVGSAGYSANT